MSVKPRGGTATLACQSSGQELLQALCLILIYQEGKLWYQIYSKPFLQKVSYETTSEEITQAITKHWEQFVQSDLPQMVDALRAEAWIWEQAD